MIVDNFNHVQTLTDVLSQTQLQLIDNCGIIAAHSQEHALDLAKAAGSLNHSDSKYLVALLSFLRRSRKDISLNPNGAGFYAIYIYSGRFAVTIDVSEKLYHAATFQQALEVGRNPTKRFKLCTTTDTVFTETNAPIYVGFYTSTQRPLMPMTTTVSRLSGMNHGDSSWTPQHIAQAFDDVASWAEFNHHSMTPQPPEDLLDLIARAHYLINSGDVKLTSEVIANDFNSLQVALSSVKEHGLASSPQLISALARLVDKLSSTLGVQFVQAIETSRGPKELYQFSVATSNDTDSRLSQNRLDEKKVAAFSIRHVSDTQTVITDRQFKGVLCLHHADQEQKKKLLDRLNGLVELTLQGENTIHFSEQIVTSSGNNDMWNFVNVTISGPVTLLGKTALTDVDLQDGIYTDVMIGRRS